MLGFKVLRFNWITRSLLLKLGQLFLNIVFLFQLGCSKVQDAINAALPSSNTELSSLQMSAGTLTPNFSSDVFTYTANVSYRSATIDFTLTTSSRTASFKINGDSPTSGSCSMAVPLVVGANVLEILVTAEDGTEQTYSITVTRGTASTDSDLTDLILSSGSLAPAFAINTTTYAVSVSDVPANFTVNATSSSADSTIEYRFNGAGYLSLTSNVPSAALTPLNGLNTLEVKVTAEDNSTKTYSINITYGTCGEGYYSDTVNSCAQVGIGYWSAGNDNSRTSCSNKPADSRYTSPTASSSNCPWSCNDGYITNNGTTCTASPTARTLYCDDNEIAVGLNGRSGSIIDRLGVRCAVLNGDGTLGTIRNGPTYGGNGGTAFNMDGTYDCPANSALFEVDGDLATYSLANRTGRIRFRCKNMNDNSLSDWFPSGATYWGSSNDRGAFNFQCGTSPNLFGKFLNGVIIDDASGAAYTGDILGITCR
jgi:hypothetical protein